MEQNIQNKDFFKVFFAKLPNNETLAYRRISNISKPILVLLHGQITTSSWFYQISKELQNVLDLIFLDLRGYGRSSYNIPIKSMQDLANDLLLFVEHLGIKKFNLLGFSLGGAVSLQFACNYSNLLENLILVSTTGICGFPIYDENHERIKSFKDMTKHLYFKKIVEKMKKKDKTYFEQMFAEELFLVPKFQDKIDIHNFFIEEILLQRNLFETCWASNSFNISNEYNDINQGTDEVKNITCRTILIHGENDKSIPYQESEKIYKNISSKNKILEIVKGVDHYVIVNNSKIIADLIKKIL